MKITDEILLALHKHYLESTLVGTSRYAWEHFRLRITRQTLSRLFREKDLPIRPANGHDGRPHVRLRYLTPYHHIAAKAIEIAMADIAAYRRGTGAYINYLTACYFFTTDRFRCLVNGLRDAAGLDVELTVPVGVTMEEVLSARQTYLEMCQYHLESEEYRNEL